MANTLTSKQMVAFDTALEPLGRNDTERGWRIQLPCRGLQDRRYGHVPKALRHLLHQPLLPPLAEDAERFPCAPRQRYVER